MDNPSKGLGPSDTSTTNTPTILTPTYPASSRASWMTRNPSLTDPSQSPEDRWREGVDPAKSSVADIITYTKWRMRVYEEDWRDESLSESFALDFVSFDQAAFLACGHDVAKRSRDFLRRGLYVRKARGLKYEVALAEAVREEIPWPEDDPERPIWGPPPRGHDTEEQPWPRQQKSEDEIWPQREE
jgi:hypothetical protein